MYFIFVLWPFMDSSDDRLLVQPMNGLCLFICDKSACCSCIISQLVGNTTEHIAEEVRAKNPLEQIPLLEFTDEHTGSTQSLTQSLAIIEFLEEAYPETHRVMPTCALRRARARQVSSLPCEFFSSFFF